MASPKASPFGAGCFSEDDMLTEGRWVDNARGSRQKQRFSLLDKSGGGYGYYLRAGGQRERKLLVPVVSGIGCWTRRSEIGIGHKDAGRGDAGGSRASLRLVGKRCAGRGRTEWAEFGRCESASATLVPRCADYSKVASFFFLPLAPHFGLVLNPGVARFSAEEKQVQG